MIIQNLKMNQTVLGIDKIDKHINIFNGKRVGLVTNPTGINASFQSSIDILKSKTNLVALFSPEHGVRANLQAGEHIGKYHDEIYDLPVYSLYGETRRPNEEMMSEIDILAIDIQDAGSRFYTFIYTMAYCMESCARFNKEFVVFDRPNPINGVDVEGNILDLKYRSFIGYYPIVQRHGMTIAELAKMFNEEFGIGCKLHLILMENWNRSYAFEETNLPWVIPSPNLPSINTAFAYNATCILEGTNVSEGRGTTVPFELFGAPWIKPETLCEKLNSFQLPGVYFRPQYFVPTFSKHQGLMCGGVFMHVTNRKVFKPVKTGWMILDVIWKMYPNEFKVRAPYVKERPCMLEFNTGCNFIIGRTKSLEQQWQTLEEDSIKFIKLRSKYLLY